MGTLTLSHCPGCRAVGATPLELGAHTALRSCGECGLVYAGEYADPADIYVDGYLSGGTEFGLDIFDDHFQEFLEFSASKRLDLIEELQPVGSLLDVGCGAGEVLRVAQQRGWSVGGAEPIEESAAVARDHGCDVRTALLADSGFPEGAWDVVSIFHVLEHMDDAEGFLRHLVPWVRPGGLVIIEVPNWGSVQRERTGDRWPSLRPLEHIAHYTPDSLTRVVEAAGLEPVLVRTLGFLWPKQTLGQQLADLGRPRWRRAMAPLSRRVDMGGRPVLIPGRVAHRLLGAVETHYNRRRRGQVVFAAARVPR